MIFMSTPKSKLQKLFTLPVCTAINEVQAVGSIFPEEKKIVSQAVSKRRNEFFSGRLAAHKVLQELGATPQPLLNDYNGIPIWPERFTGSISHCDQWCGAVAAKTDIVKSLGLDVEPNTPLPDELGSMIISPQEMPFLSQTTLTMVDWKKIIFCAKEAFYKCLFPLTGCFLEFREVELLMIQTTETTGIFTGKIVRENNIPLDLINEIQGRWYFDRTLVWAGATLSPTCLIN